MINVKKLSFVLILTAILFVTSGVAVFAQWVGGVTVQTNLPTNVSNYQTTLNGNLSIPYISNSNYVYFQWGTTNGYGNQTNQQYLNNGSFSQVISGLNYNTSYHYRAVAQGSFGTVYGQDVVFYMGQQEVSGSNYVQTNLPTNIFDTGATFNGYLYGSSQSTNYAYFQWGTTQGYGYETPKTTIGYSGSFSQTMGNLTPNTIYHYRAVSQSGYYGTTIYGPDVVFTTYGGTVYVPPIVYNYTGGGQVLGVSTVDTGLTNNFFTDSFFMPLLIIILSLWLYFSGRVDKLANRLKLKFRK